MATRCLPHRRDFIAASPTANSPIPASSTPSGRPATETKAGKAATPKGSSIATPPRTRTGQLPAVRSSLPEQDVGGKKAFCLTLVHYVAYEYKK